MTDQWMRCCLVIALLLCVQTLPASADLYSWTDENGVKHFSNEPPPANQAVEHREEIKHDAGQYKQWDEARQNQQDKMLEDRAPETDGAKVPAATQAKATKRPGKVAMYVTPSCGYCKKAKSFFNQHGIAFAEYDITTDPAAMKRFKALKGNGVPLILVGDKRIPGFNQPMLSKLFGIAPAKTK